MSVVIPDFIPVSRSRREEESISGRTGCITYPYHFHPLNCSPLEGVQIYFRGVLRRERPRTLLGCPFRTATIKKYGCIHFLMNALGAFHAAFPPPNPPSPQLCISPHLYYLKTCLRSRHSFCRCNINQCLRLRLDITSLLRLIGAKLKFSTTSLKIERILSRY